MQPSLPDTETRERLRGLEPAGRGPGRGGFPGGGRGGSTGAPEFSSLKAEKTLLPRPALSPTRGLRPPPAPAGPGRSRGRSRSRAAPAPGRSGAALGRALLAAPGSPPAPQRSRRARGSSEPPPEFCPARAAVSPRTGPLPARRAAAAPNRGAPVGRAVTGRVTREARTAETPLPPQPAGRGRAIAGRTCLVRLPVGAARRAPAPGLRSGRARSRHLRARPDAGTALRRSASSAPTTERGAARPGRSGRGHSPAPPLLRPRRCHRLRWGPRGGATGASGRAAGTRTPVAPGRSRPAPPLRGSARPGSAASAQAGPGPVPVPGPPLLGTAELGGAGGAPPITPQGRVRPAKSTSRHRAGLPRPAPPRPAPPPAEAIDARRAQRSTSCRARGQRRRPAAFEAWWSIAMAAQMTDAHRRFLQVLMSHGIMEGSEARKLHRCCCEIHKVYYAHDKLDYFITTINSHLQPLFMQIRKGMSEGDGRAHYALVNLAETEITKMASDYAENELELFRKTMDLIMLSENGFASSTDILNLADQLKTKKMKKKEAEQMLKVFVENKWLSERNGEYTLHTRCIIEMEQYILTNYPDTARKCNICHSLAIQSQVCESCGTGMHLPCVRKYFRAQTEPRCPQCNTTWSCDIPGTHPRDSQSPSRTRRAEKSFTLSTR